MLRCRTRPCASRASRCRTAELGDLAAAVGVEARHHRQWVELDIRGRVHRVHFRQQRRREAPDLGQQGVGIVEGQVPKFEIEAAVARHDVERGAAAHHAGVDGRVGYVVGRVVDAAITKTARHVRQERDDLAGDLHGVHAARRQRGMRLVSTHAAAVALLALVRDDQVHAGGFADDATGRLDASRADVRDQAPHADTADFLVVRQREVQRALEPAAQEFRNERQRDRRKALHVGGATAVESVADDRRRERRRVPRLAVDRHHVGVSRQNDAASRRVTVLAPAA